MWNNVVSDVDAFWQAVQPFVQNYKIQRKQIRSYNARGRVCDVTTEETIRAVIQPGGKSINTNQQGTGSWVKSDYSIYMAVPEYVEIGDIIIAPQYGRLKVIDVEDNRYEGVMSASLVRTGTTDNIPYKQNSRYEPK